MDLDTHTQTQTPPPPTQPPTTTTTTISNSKSLSFTNGSIKRHHQPQPPPPPAVVSYKECLKNHAASIGGHALDGCGEFMPSTASDPRDPRSLKCAACGCHRNFHRRDPHELIHSNPNFLSCFYPPPPPLPLPHRELSPSSTSQSPSPSPSSTSPSPLSSPSPPPVSHFPPSYHHHAASAPHMLLALGNAYSGPSDDHHHHPNQHRGFINSSAMKMERENHHPNGKKRFRTKFSQEQKEKMYSFSEKLGWRMQKGDDRTIQDFCNDVGVSRGVFKVWMHNNKNTFRKKSSETENTQTDQKINDDVDNDDDRRNAEGSCLNLRVSVNGSS